MHDLPLLIEIAVAIVVALFGGFFARKVGLPTIVGYMLGGILIGPFTPGYVSDGKNISQLAELGVIFLMFGVGLHFSLTDLWKVRGIAIPGAIGQMALSALFGIGLGLLWGWSISAGLILGLAVSIASTVVLLRGLTDNGLLNSPHGQAAVGWLVLEDIATVLILIFLPLQNMEGAGFDLTQVIPVIVKATIFIVLALLIGKRFIPWFINQIAYTRSYELFVLSILGISLGTALAAVQLFGISLALGAFIAGILVKESPLNHQVGADLAPFREAFSVLFFVSIGMLVDPIYIWTNWNKLLSLCLLIIVGKPIITILLGILFRWPARTSLVVAAGLSQIGEFSFILGQAGMQQGLITNEQYSLILAGALLTITLNPFMFMVVAPVEKWLIQRPNLWKIMGGLSPELPTELPTLNGHVVIVGYGRVGQHIASLLQQLNIAFLVVDHDPEVVNKLTKTHTPVLYGDAANSEILSYAGLANARALVVARPDEAGSELIVAGARQITPKLPIIARASTTDGQKRLAKLGAQHVVHPEMEGGLEMVQFTLAKLGFPPYEIFKYREIVRSENYDLEINTESEHKILAELMQAVQNAEISWLTLPENSPIIGMSIYQADLRARTGASIVAVSRNRQILPNPKSQMIFQANDWLGLIGDTEQIKQVEKLISEPK